MKTIDHAELWCLFSETKEEMVELKYESLRLETDLKLAKSEAAILRIEADRFNMLIYNIEQEMRELNERTYHAFPED